MKALTLILLASLSIAQTSGSAWQTLKSLAGEWQAISPDGKVYRVRYQVISSGSAVMETLNPPDEPDMVSVYHQDGGRIAMRHFCSANNQPSLEAEATAGSSLQFRFVSASNLRSPAAGHIHGLVMEFASADQIRHRWTWRENGKDSVLVLNLQRKRR